MSRPAPRKVLVMNVLRTLRWERQPCDDDDAKRLADAIKVPPIVARLLCLRGLGDPEQASRFLDPSLDHLHDPYLPDRSRAGRRSPDGRDRAQGARRGARRLRRRRRDLHGHPAPRDRAARRRRDPLPARADARRLRPAARGDRSPARAGRARHRVGGLRHPQRRGGAARGGARRRSDHHGSSRAGRRRCRPRSR